MLHWFSRRQDGTVPRQTDPSSSNRRVSSLHNRVYVTSWSAVILGKLAAIKLVENSRAFCRTKGLPLISISIHTVTRQFCKTHFNTVFSSMTRSLDQPLSLNFTTKACKNSYVYHVCYMLSPTHRHWYRPNNIWRRVQFMKLLTMHLSPVSCYFLRVWGRGEVCTGFWWGNLRERDRSGDPDVDGRIILKLIFRKWKRVVGTGWSWLRIGTGGGHLWIRWGTFGFHKMRGISWLAAEPVSLSRRTLLHGVSNYYYYWVQKGCHSVAVVLTPVQTKQIRINIHKRNSTKTVQTTQNAIFTLNRKDCQLQSELGGLGLKGLICTVDR